MRNKYGDQGFLPQYIPNWIKTSMQVKQPPKFSCLDTQKTPP